MSGKGPGRFSSRFLDRYAVATMISRNRIMLRRVTVDQPADQFAALVLRKIFSTEVDTKSPDLRQ